MPVNPAGRLPGRRVLAVAGVVIACALLWTAAAAAESFTVNTAADEADATIGDFICFTADEKCSLRAALEEANSSTGEFDAIGFEEGVFEGDGDSVIELTEELPAIVDPLLLASERRCETEAGVQGPCVEIDGVGGAPVLSVEGVEETEIEGLALTNAKAGLVADTAPRLRVRGNWFGVGLDGAAGGNGLGIEVGPGSDGSRIGVEDPELRNFIANSAGTGLVILGSSNVRVLGTEFGLAPGGNQPAPNGANIVIESTAGGADAVGNAIGTRAGAAAAASPECDLGCNLVSGSSGNGIDLSGDGAGDPPIETTIVGNHIGLDRAGTGSLPNAGVGILVGAAPETTIGGPRAADANRIAGGTAAVLAGPGAPYLAVQRNLIGSRATMAGSTEPPDEGIVVDSEGVSTPAEEALILENEIGLLGGAGISHHQGQGATILGNRVLGATTGIRVHGEGFESLIEGNAIAASGDAGILVESSFNEVVGNEVSGGNAGIRINGTPPQGVKGNVVGGDSAAAENVIDGSGNAIEIINTEESLNEVARNRGSGNAGLFIDLRLATPDPGGPNKDIPPPPIVLISTVGAAGFAEPGATIRVFRKQTPIAGEIQAFLGQATADEDGNWSFVFPAPLPPGAGIAATQTKEGGTSELEIATIPLSGGEGQSKPSGGADLLADRRPPRTRMLRQPRRVLEGGVARFSFTSNEPGSRFQCRLDGGRFRACASPKKYRNLRPGRHVFRVRAIDPAGNVDPTPLRRRFEVLD